MKKELQNAGEAGKLKVLIADDSEHVRDLLARLISGIPGFQLEGQAQDGLEALELIEKLDPDVMILDLQMPRMGGLKVLETLKQQDQRCVVFVLTARYEEAYRDRCLQLGARHFFEKGTQFEQFIDALKRLCLAGRE